MSIELTASAADEIRQVLRAGDVEEKEQYLRVGVKGHGPQRQYTLAFGEPDAGETIVESQGIRISFNPRERSQLENVKIDHREIGGARGFVFESPTSDISRQQRPFDPAAAPPQQPQVLHALRDVIDPEVGMNIVDLGLVYGVAISERSVRVTMTMTTPACPLSEHIRNEVNSHVLAECPGAEQVEVEIVWEPRWGPDKISPEAKKMLGW